MIDTLRTLLENLRDEHRELSDDDESKLSDRYALLQNIWAVQTTIRILQKQTASHELEKEKAV